MEHIVVAVDASAASRNAAATAAQWAAAAGARMTLMTVAGLRPTAALQRVAGDTAGHAALPEVLESIERGLRQQFGQAAVPAPALAATYGVPSIAITRFAEERRADLLVLGRKQRSPEARLLIGDTADAVASRSGIPCLFVPVPVGVPRRLLVALDGTDRGGVVYLGAQRIAAAIGAALDVVTVERTFAGEPSHLAQAMRTARSENLERVLHRDGVAVRVRRGPIVPEILAEIERLGAEALVVGCHRGRPPVGRHNESVARELAHHAPCAVLTVPL
ncbi:MAG TPA: universal stress protein [Gemmatimonadales bacterium]|nr:universal stress protein [Gemmatimonadales bacterium]